MEPHAFLFREGRWRVAGEHCDGAGKRTPVEGETRIRHAPDKWRSESVMRLKAASSPEHRNVYEIEPFSPNAQSTHWSSEHPSLGALRGRFVVSGDAILSFYGSATGRYRGFECIQRRDATRYAVHGAMLEEDKVLSTWAVELELQA